MSSYFSDRERGPVPRTSDNLPDAAWGGLVALFHGAIERGDFGFSFPEKCSDGGGAVFGANGYLLGLQLAAAIPDLGFAVNAENNPGVVTAMDFIEFAWRYVASPTITSHHGFFSHDHLKFDVQAGQKRWRDDVNLILSRNGIALELAKDGKACRLGTAAAQTVLARALPATGDPHLDSKIENAIIKYHDPDPKVRREALEALWDALERLKTILDPSKIEGTKKLIQKVSSEPAAQALLDADYKALTTVGNDFMIRHHETQKTPVADALIDYFFVRCLALLETLIRAAY